MSERTLGDIHYQATLLAGLLDGVDAMQHELNEDVWGEAIAAGTRIARDLALRLAEDIDVFDSDHVIRPKT